MTSSDETEPFSTLRKFRSLSHEEEMGLSEGACSSIGYRGMIHEAVHKGYRFGRPCTEFDYDCYFGASDSFLDVENMLVTAERTEWPADKYLGQLIMYGVLQALMVQYEATQQILRCFGRVDFFSHREILNEIKELRIAVAGHPSNHVRGNIKIKGCTFLGHQVFGSKTKFTVVTYENFAKTVHREIDVLKLIASQALAINANLACVWLAIEERGGIAANLFSERRS